MIRRPISLSKHKTNFNTKPTHTQTKFKYCPRRCVDKNPLHYDNPGDVITYPLGYRYGSHSLYLAVTALACYAAKHHFLLALLAKCVYVFVWERAYVQRSRIEQTFAPRFCVCVFCVVCVCVVFKLCVGKFDDSTSVGLHEIKLAHYAAANEWVCVSGCVCACVRRDVHSQYLGTNITTHLQCGWWR